MSNSIHLLLLYPENTLDRNEEQTQTELSSFSVNGAGVTLKRNKEHIGLSLSTINVPDATSVNIKFD